MMYYFSVEIIGDSMETNLEESITSYPSVDHLVTEVHPSNMEVSSVVYVFRLPLYQKQFSDEVLKGRKVAFHTVPKVRTLYSISTTTNFAMTVLLRSISLS